LELQLRKLADNLAADLILQTKVPWRLLAAHKPEPDPIANTPDQGRKRMKKRLGRGSQLSELKSGAS
jgi:hypothetical protein